eukprot:2567029-Ditylum_brightwellii.AAC.1
MSLPFNKEILGRVLGPAKDEGNQMAQWVEELNSKTEIRSHNLFDSLIKRRWGTSMNPLPETTPDDQDQYDEYEDDDEKA